MGCDRYQGELEEGDEEYEAGHQDESRDLRVAPSQDTELHRLCGSPEVLRISSSTRINRRKQKAPSDKLGQYVTYVILLVFDIPFISISRHAGNYLIWSV